MKVTTPLPKLSVIIPVLNDSAGLRACLTQLTAEHVTGPEIEIILCDGGSHDDTLEVAQNFPLTIVHSPPGRARQMNAGARVARGQTLLFLHADTLLPDDGCRAVIDRIESGFSMGCFDRKFSGDHPLLKITSAWAGWRVRKTFWAYGDQAIFIRRDIFQALGGYQRLPRFEDLDLAIRAKAHGRWTVIDSPVISDARRFRHGTLRRVLGDFLLTIAWLSGIIKK